MKQFKQSLWLIPVLLLMMSFRFPSGSEIAGTYGVCADDPSGIELILQEDHSFSYQNFSNPDKKIEVRGEWSQKGKAIFLTQQNSTQAFHDKWRISPDGQVARSRKGMTFYTLRRK